MSGLRKRRKYKAAVCAAPACFALSWEQDQIVVIDSELGQSGASAADREGFQRLVTEVSLGRAGIVLGLEVSRLSMDWHRLLGICALTDTLILDEDGVYDPAHFNDRLYGPSVEIRVRTCAIPPEANDPAYITWQEYGRNLKRLRESAQAIGCERRKSPPCEGAALLQGLVVCGKCGRRMALRYHARKVGLCPEYV